MLLWGELDTVLLVTQFQQNWAFLGNEKIGKIRMTLVKTMTLKLIIFLLPSSELSHPLACCILPGFVLDHLFYSGFISAVGVLVFQHFSFTSAY